MNDRLKQLRNYFKLSQAELGAKLGVGNTAISKIEKGERSLTDTMVKLICTEFGVAEDWLRGSGSPMFPPKTRDEKMGGQFGKLYGVSSFRKDIIEFFLDLTDEECDQIEKFTDKLVRYLAEKKGKESE